MSRFVMDQPTLKQRKGNAHVSGMLHGYSSIVMVDVRAGGEEVGLFGFRPLPLYSSLPSFAATKQPPLLPLPFSTSATLSSPSRKVAAAAPAAGPGDTRRARQHKKPPRSSRKEKRSLADTARSEPKPVGKTASEVKLGEPEEDEEEVLLGGWLYSPPPSSLPLPTFSLVRPTMTDVAAAAPNCISKTVAGGGGGVVAGATNDLRRLLDI